jgi:hypothetical protein
MELTYDNIKKWYADNKYVFCTRPFEVNMLGIRKSYDATNLFDDKFVLTYNDGRNDKILVFNRFTTDPGYYFLKIKFMNPKGCAFLKEGQHINMFTRGKHGSKQYEALIQYAPVTVYRDTNKDNTLDKGKEEKGMFGIDFHHGYNCALVYNNSAGCQVLEDIKDLESLLPLFDLHERTYGRGINYTLTTGI